MRLSGTLWKHAIPIPFPQKADANETRESTVVRPDAKRPWRQPTPWNVVAPAVAPPSDRLGAYHCLTRSQCLPEHPAGGGKT